MIYPSITIFGSSSPRPGQAAYIQAQTLGVLLAKVGFTVLTGGYIGTMEAVSRGASEAGGHVIGVTCDEIEAWRPVGKNPWVMEERRFPTLRQRLYALIDDCDAAIALPGGIGTLAEVSAFWSQTQTGSSPRRPLILVGPEWRRSMLAFIENMESNIASHDRDLLDFAPDVDSALNILKIRLLPKTE